MMVRLSLQTENECRSWQTDDWSVLVALAALSAEPESIEEFYQAVSRYLPSHRWNETSIPSSLEKSKTNDGNWCLIDLDARSVVAGRSFNLPDPNGAYQADETDLSAEFPIVWLAIPDSWQYESASEDCMTRLEERRRCWRLQRRIEVREIIYGREMLEFIVDRCFSEASNLDDNRCDEAIRRLHAEWLMTTRTDLLGKTPRDWLLEELSRLQNDLQHRADQWSRQGFPPPTLDETSGAYRFGGFGTTEVVIYFKLMRMLIGVAWEMVSSGDVGREALICHLVEHRDRFLDQDLEEEPSEYSYRQLIEFERKRLPVVSHGAHLFDDCPLCRASADEGLDFGPTFMWYDAHELELEDEFAFSTILSRAEWEQEQLELQQFREKISRNQRPAEPLQEDEATIWNSSFVNWDVVRTTGSSQLSLAIGFPFSELISDLQSSHAEKEIIDSLQKSYESFRRSEDSITRRSSADSLKSQLEEVACVYPKFVSKSADLQSLIDEILRLSD